MFAASYFAPRYFAPRYFQPSGDAVPVAAERKPAGVKKAKYWKFEEDLPYPVLVQAMEREEDRLILQAYLDSLRKKHKEEKTEVLHSSAIRLVASDTVDGREGWVLESNNRVLILMAAMDLL